MPFRHAEQVIELHNQAIRINEHDNYVEIVTPSCAEQTKQFFKKTRDVTTKYYYSASMLALLQGAMLMLTDRPTTTGRFVDGALVGYQQGRILGLNQFNQTAPQNYSIYILSPDFSHPISYDSVDVSENWIIQYVLAGVAGVAVWGVFHALIAQAPNYDERNKRVKSACMSFTLGLSAMMLYAVGGLVVNHHFADYIYADGVQAGNSVYGFGDGQNYYCPQMNYTGLCPSSTQYYDLLENSLPSFRLTQEVNTLNTIMTLLVCCLLVPFTSALMSGAKYVYERGFFGRRNAERQQLVDAQEADYGSSSEQESVAPNFRVN